MKRFPVLILLMLTAQVHGEEPYAVEAQNLQHRFHNAAGVKNRPARYPVDPDRAVRHLKNPPKPVSRKDIGARFLGGGGLTGGVAGGVLAGQAGWGWAAIATAAYTGMLAGALLGLGIFVLFWIIRKAALSA